MDAREWLYEQWAPEGGLWTPWAKPVLFAQMTYAPPQADAALPTLYPENEPWARVDVDWAPPAGQRAVILLDLPGEWSVLAGLALAHRGYRPVPLFNCCAGASAAVNVTEIVDGLRLGGSVLPKLKLPYDAPPAFLLDSQRNNSVRVLKPGDFDNRWLVLPQDFPSHNLLLSHGYQEVIVAVDRRSIQSDLAHVLARWQAAGMTIEQLQLGVDAAPAPVKVAKPSRFGYAWYAMLATIGLRRSAAGGFGALVPHPSQSSGSR